MWRGKTIDELYHILAGGADIDFATLDEDTKAITTFAEIIKHKNPIFKPYDEKLCASHNNLFKRALDKKNNNDNDVPHTGQPSIDPIKGRPHLGWNECKYKKCQKKFKNSLALVNHLISCNAYTQGYHYHHETAIFDLGLTEEKVLTQNLTKCPSYACNHKEFAKPDELIMHLKKN